MTPRAILREVYRRDPVLAVTGWIHVALAAAMIVALPFDDRPILGVSRWLKPLKFALSSTLYLWTLAWLKGYLLRPRAALGIVSWGVAAAMLVEIACIAGQSLRGASSHYNIATPLDAVIFGGMGFAILVNTLLVAVVLLIFLLAGPALPAPHLWGIRLALLVFVMGSLESGVMILRGAHTVGLPDGGPGVPLLNWSTTAGDLRVAYFLGLHALQVLSLAGYAVARLLPGFARGLQVGLVVAFAVFYVGVMAALFAQALSGRPLFAVFAA